MKGTHHERTNERTNDRPTDRPTLALPPALRRALAAIAAAEGMTVRELVSVAVRELVAAYPPRPHDGSRAPAEQLETVWAPHRDAPSLLGDCRSRGSVLGTGEPYGIAGPRAPKRRAAA
jgi:hypothetical protein